MTKNGHPDPSRGPSEDASGSLVADGCDRSSGCKR
jgi:hypothetical protein